MATKPYLVVKFIEQPRDGVNTSKAGWMKNPDNIKTVELVSAVDRLTNKHSLYPVVIDLVEGKAVTNRTNKPDDEMIAHYIERYSDTIQIALRNWAMKELKNG